LFFIYFIFRFSPLGRPLVFEWVADNVQAILYTWFLGTRAGDAIVDVFFLSFYLSFSFLIFFDSVAILFSVSVLIWRRYLVIPILQANSQSRFHVLLARFQFTTITATLVIRLLRLLFISDYSLFSIYLIISFVRMR
jgi:hypothetical protein